MMREVRKKEKQKALKKGIKRGYKPQMKSYEEMARARAGGARGFYREAAEAAGFHREASQQVRRYDPGDIWTDGIIDTTGRFSNISNSITDQGYGNEKLKEVNAFSKRLRDYVE